MKEIDMSYMESQNNNERVIRTEILFIPLLVFAPLIVGLLLIYDWITRDFLTGELNLLGELMLGIIILICNIIFDIPFVKSLHELSKKK